MNFNVHYIISQYWFWNLSIITVYQRTPDIAISEVSECLQGHHTRSVFLDLSFVFYELWVKGYISDLVDTLMYTYDHNN